MHLQIWLSGKSHNVQLTFIFNFTVWQLFKVFLQENQNQAELCWLQPMCLCVALHCVAAECQFSLQCGVRAKQPPHSISERGTIYCCPAKWNIITPLTDKWGEGRRSVSECLGSRSANRLYLKQTPCLIKKTTTKNIQTKQRLWGMEAVQITTDIKGDPNIYIMRQVI